MADITPTFCKDLLANSENDSISFSFACKGLRDSKRKDKYSCSNIKIKSRSPHRSKKDKSKFKIKHNRHHSEKFNLKMIDDIHSNTNSEKFYLSDKSNNVSLNIKKTFDNKDINTLMKKHKFKLRNDFDKKHSEKFLYAKEIAFEMPFLLKQNIM